MVELIHADSALNEIGVISDFICYDSVVALSGEGGSGKEESDWVLEIPDEIFGKRPVSCGDYVYIENSEWGGPVCRIKHTTSDGVVRIYGINWREILGQRIIRPPAGQTHYVFASVDANQFLRNLAGGWMDHIIKISGKNSGLTVGGSARYKPLLGFAESLLSEKSWRLDVNFYGGKAVVSAFPVRDLANDTELSGEYEAEITAVAAHGKYNHILALGQGEMLDRDVAELWLLPDGQITGDPMAPGVPAEAVRRTLLYDFSAAESPSVLRQNAERKLLEAAASDTTEIDLSADDADVELTDLVMVRDTLSGQAKRLRVVSKNLRITESGERVTISLR
ncbi:MAG: siphovirus ReqiPepy6 Gp37-like family protein [Oscillospiraceae bacterium]|nr:siphovirus ReqiPepy6 Gp37-like family protein [Oscillospiraceae bacterium]